MNPKSDLSLTVCGLAFALFFTACTEPESRPGEVAPADFSTIDLADFADHELEVPYFLFHFAQVANAVVLEGENRGFLDLRVNRDPKDNQPYNARIMEMQKALAYFYGVDRPWNPYYGVPAVRTRLEAMLDRWTRIQNSDGLYAEYSPDNWSLAPTNFGAMAAAQTLEILIASGQGFDQEILDRGKNSLRRALMAIFTREDMRRHARQWSNQFSGSYSAALTYLTLWPDEELEAAFTRAVADAVAQDQSPAGFHYEQGGPDFGYSNVHETNLKIALPRLRDRPDLLKLILDADTAWNQWLAANFVPQPGLSEPLFLINAGINTRTSQAVQKPQDRPLAEWVEPARAFAVTQAEHRNSLDRSRENLREIWGRWGPLSTPNAQSYRPSFVYSAWRPLHSWQPDDQERDQAILRFPHLASDNFTRLFHDAWPVTVTSVRRPSYYAIFNSGRIRTPRQKYGLGLLWHQEFGTALQSVAETRWAWGTRAEGEDGKLYEQSDLAATFTIEGTLVSAEPGVTDLPAGTMIARYALGEIGTKSLSFDGSHIRVTVSHPGPFTEVIPLVMPADADAPTTANRIELQRRGGVSFVVNATSPTVRISLSEPEALGDGLVRRLATITAEDSLTYELRFE